MCLFCDLYWLVTCSIWQVAGDDYFYIEGASASIPLSIAKVCQTSNAYFWIVDDVQILCLDCQLMHVFSQVTLNESKTKVINFSIVWSSSPDVVQYKPFFSKPEIVEFPTYKPGQKAYAYFYPPTNPNFQGLPDVKPPLLVKTHGK